MTAPISSAFLPTQPEAAQPPSAEQPAATVSGLLRDIADVGRDRTRGGYSRPVFSRAETELRSWFIAEAGRRGLDVHTDQNGIIWAWWDTATGTRRNAVVTGSHLDSVPGGGEYDGPLGSPRHWSPSTFSKRAASAPAAPWPLQCSPKRKGPGSAWLAWGHGC